MKKIVFLIGVILVVSTTFVCGEQMTSLQNIDVKSKEVRMDKIKAFVDGFETFAKKIIDDYKKEVEGIEAKYKAEKYRKMTHLLVQYFRDADFNLNEWLLIEAEFSKRCEIRESERDGLGSSAAYVMIRQNIEKNLPQSFEELLKVISNKAHNNRSRITYVSYVRELLHEILYYPNQKFKVNVNDEMKNKIIDVLVITISDKTNDVKLRSESAFLLAGYFGDNKKAVDSILNILENANESDEVRSRAIFGAGVKFGVAKDKRVLEKLIYISKNKDNYSTEIVNRTIRTLSYLNNKDVINVGVSILDTTDDEKLFLETIASLSKTNDKEAIKAILRNNSKFGIYTINSFYQNDEILIDIMNNESKEYTLPAIEALGANIAKDTLNVVKQLETKMYDADPKIKSASIRAIRKRGKHGSVELKREILAAFNKVKIEEKNREVLQEIENSIKMLESN